jgi:hypothetical protein
MMLIIICPGIHDPKLTESFVAGLYGSFSEDLLTVCCRQNLKIFPAQNYPAYSAFHIVQFLRETTGEPTTSNGLNQWVSSVPLVFISFSAGVAGAIAAAWAWQQMGGCVKALVALDGWGVPLYGDFPIHRVSHDDFTHWSSALLGSGEDSFFCDPPVEHLELWRNPQTVQGWWVQSKQQGVTAPQTGRSRSTAAQFLTMLLERYAG